MKKLLFTTMAILALSLSSCNDDNETIKYSDAVYCADGLTGVNRNLLYATFEYAELVSIQIGKGEAADVTIITSGTDTTGWEKTFDSGSGLFSGTIKVDFIGSPISDTAVKVIDCSGLKYGSYDQPVFGEIEVSTISQSSTSKTYNVTTNSLGWGNTTQEFWLNGYYTFECTLNAAETEISKTLISGGASGTGGYGSYTFSIDEPLQVGTSIPFVTGSATISASKVSAGMPITITYSSSGYSVTNNGITEVVNYYY